MEGCQVYLGTQKDLRGGTKPPKMAKKCKKNFVPSLLGPKRSEGGGEKLNCPDLFLGF